VTEQRSFAFIDKRTIAARFAEFDAANPRIYALLCRYADEVRAAGLSHYGVAAVFERIRWHVRVETRGDDFKLNNDFRALYARKWIAEHPEAADFFETRERRTE
jgi:hypothetical protein